MQPSKLSWKSSSITKSCAQSFPPKRNQCFLWPAKPRCNYAKTGSLGTEPRTGCPPPFVPSVRCNIYCGSRVCSLLVMQRKGRTIWGRITQLRKRQSHTTKRKGHSRKRKSHTTKRKDHPRKRKGHTGPTLFLWRGGGSRRPAGPVLAPWRSPPAGSSSAVPQTKP